MNGAEFMNGTVEAARAEAAARDKEISLLTALCARAGFALYVTAGPQGAPAFMASRWGRSISFASTDALREWLERAAGSAP